MTPSTDCQNRLEARLPRERPSWPRRRSLTLAGTLTATALTLASAGIVAPWLGGLRLLGLRERAAADLASLASGMRGHVERTRTLPIGPRGAPVWHWAYSGGMLPAGNRFASGPGVPAAEWLATLEPTAGAGAAPPRFDVASDPWGNAYLVNLHGWFSSAELVQLVSAGPNGLVETEAHQRAAGGDDVLLLLE